MPSVVEFFLQSINSPYLLFLAFVMVTLWYFMKKKGHPDNLPPFPSTPYPIVGHLLDLRGGGILETFQKWRNKVGNIFSLQLGSQQFIVFNDWGTLKEAFVRKGEHFAERPTQNVLSQHKLKNKGGLKGIIFNNGANWKEQRTVSMQILKEFGMGKNWMAEKITEEVQVYIDTMSKVKGHPQDVRITTIGAVSNVICAILIGHRFELDDPVFVRFLQMLNEITAILSSVGVVSLFPFLRHLPGDLFKAKRLLSHESEFLNYFSSEFVQKTKEKGEGQNLIGSYLYEIDKKQNLGVETSLNEDNLLHVMANLFAAGSETTSITILWALVYAIHYPDAQEKFYQDVLDVIGTERLVTMQDKFALNYVNAFIMETQRIGSVVPLGITHLCTKTVEIGGYTIPEGTAIIPNLDAVLKDEKTWGDPLVFRPERFLDENNKVVVPEQFIPFSIGRRYCMGESLARMELFLFITCLFQRFQILPEDPDDLPSLSPVVGLTSVPQEFRVRFVERDQDRAM